MVYAELLFTTTVSTLIPLKVLPNHKKGSDLSLIIFLFFVGSHNDSRMNMALVMSAVHQGAVVANHMEVVECKPGKLMHSIISL